MLRVSRVHAQVEAAEAAEAAVVTANHIEQAGNAES